MNKEIKDNNILLCITGGSPQVVTETLYCLITQEPPYIPTEIHIVSTSTGIQKAKRQLEAIDSEEDKYEGKSIMEEFCEVMQKELNKTKYSSSTIGQEQPNIFYYTLKKGQNTEEKGQKNNEIPINDIYTKDDSEATANYIVELIKRLCSIEDNANIKHTLHVSIAGGRKTMSFYAGYALSLFGRKNDKLSHVLIESDGGTTPSTFEKIQTIYFPKQIRPLKKDPKTKEVIKEIHANDAKLALTEIPIVKLHSQLPREFIKNDGNDTPPTYEDIVKRSQSAMDKDSYELSFDIKKRIVEINGVPIKLGKKLLATFLATIKYFYEIKNPKYNKIRQLNEDDERKIIKYFECDGPFFEIHLRIWNFIEKITNKHNHSYKQEINFNDTEFFDNLKKSFIDDFLKLEDKEKQNKFIKGRRSDLEKFVLTKFELSKIVKERNSPTFDSVVHEFKNSTSGVKAIYTESEAKDSIMNDLSIIKGKDRLSKYLTKTEAEYFSYKTKNSKENKNRQNFVYYEINPKQIKAESTMGILDPKFYK